jgi:3'5'-cyclic nucleotide phosphodiesterase
VLAKGKGEMQTYWCNPNNGSESDYSTKCSSVDQEEENLVDDTDKIGPGQIGPLVDWNVEVFERFLKDIVYERGISQPKQGATQTTDIGMKAVFGEEKNEILEVLTFRNGDEIDRKRSEPGSIELDDAVMRQLRGFIVAIAARYRNNHFHNFAHSAHVVMSTVKLLDRIAASDSDDNLNVVDGIARDPLVRLAIVFSALIHDVDHPGVGNATLVSEHSQLAQKYDGKSVAEQNSVDIAFALLFQPEYADLLNCVCHDNADRIRFRQIVVNVVLATDLFDQDMKAIRQSRWDKSFNRQHEGAWSQSDSNRRSTIVLDLIIQSSDVSHTMQHFTVYKKWNMRLLAEMHKAYRKGRVLKDPTDGWYEGELWFFDNYVIPLAQKLKDCGVFGVSSFEFLDYAKDNRMEWECKGQQIVQLAKVMLELDGSAKFQHSAVSLGHY